MAKRKKKHTLVKVLAVAVVAAAGGSAVWVNYIGRTADTTAETQSYKEETVRYGSVISGITESGSVTLGSQEQTFSLAEITEVSSSTSDSSSSSESSTSAGTASAAYSAQMTAAGMQGGTSSMSGMNASTSTSGTTTSSGTTLEVEEVYVSAGQVVAEGDPVLKITDESIEDYRSELESAVASAQLLVSQEEINVESKQAEADYTYDMYIAEGKTAQETYDATITSLENEISDLEEELEEAAEEVDDLQDELDAGYDVEDDLEEAQLNYSTIEANLQIARNNLTTGTIEAKQTYENAMTNYKYADQLYAIDTDGLEDDLNDAKDTLEEAEEALAEFEAQIGDGIVYAEYSGTVTEVACAAGDSLADESSVLTCADPENVTMTVSVTQDDISSISVGSEAVIELTAYSGEEFAGEVSAIATSTSAGSSTVNYDVTVLFTGDTSKVYSGMTGETTFAVKQVSDTLYVSNKAVYQDGTRTYVKVLQDDGSVEEVDVETGFSNGSSVEVISGLEEGQTVVIESRVSE